MAAAAKFSQGLRARPHRPALSADYAATEMRRAVTAGTLLGDAVSAVLAAAGQSRERKGRPLRPAGLTEREMEVVRLLARGCTDRQIAERLIVSERTAHHHVEHIFGKLSVSTRAAATVVALQHGLIADPLESGDSIGYCISSAYGRTVAERAEDTSMLVCADESTKCYCAYDQNIQSA